MAILGITHDEKGAALEKLPVRIKVAVGEGPDPEDENSQPRGLFHFVFKRRVLRHGYPVWESAPEIAEVFGENPTELRVILFHDSPAEVFQSELAIWTSTGRYCHGELVQIGNNGSSHYEMRAVRKTKEHPEGEAWPGQRKYLDGPQKGQPIEGCGAGCPELESGNCRPSGDLYFILEKFPSLGAICRLHTSSKTSVPNLSSAVEQLFIWNDGHLKGVRATLRVTPEYRNHPGRGGNWETSVVPTLSLESAGATLEDIVSDTQEGAAGSDGVEPLFDGEPETEYVVRESEEERAQEIATEFYPVEDRPRKRPEAVDHWNQKADRRVRRPRFSAGNWRELPPEKYYRPC
jgi:hypothetical protein